MSTARFYVQTASVGETLIGALDTAEVLSYSASEIRLGVPGGATLMIMYGQFSFTAGGDLTAGTLTGITTYLADGVTKEMVLSGMSIDLLVLVDIAMSGTEDDLINLFFGGPDRFTGSPGADELPTYGGNDTIDGGAGNDTMEGGNGNDLYYVRDPGDRIVETASSSAGGGIDTAQSYLASYTLPGNVENGRIMTSTAAKLAGNSLANLLTGGIGADTLVGGAGNDKLNGGEGSDTADYSGATAAVKLNLSLTGAQVTGGAGTDTLASIENLVGSGFADQFVGNGGDDTLDGGAGNDTLIGGNGNDTYQLRDAGDSASETSATSSGGVDTVLSYLGSHTLGANIENGRIMSTGTASLSGNALNNLLLAGAGNNALNGGSGIDTVSYAGAAAAVKLGLSASGGQVTGGSGTDTLSGIENLIGSAYNDTLVGNGGANALSGGNGNDLLNGGSGIDRLTGGGGADLFRLNSTPNASTNIDTLTDFRGVDDAIQLENAVFAKLVSVGVLPASNFAANTSGRAVDGNDFVVYETDTGKLYYDADGSGAGAAVQIALLTGAPVLANVDLFVT
jgi:Ca2+-binding RTX toxin-like protein